MSDVPLVQAGALDNPPAEVSLRGSHGDLAEPLEVIRLSLESIDAARARFPGYRLTRLARLELDEIDVGRLSSVFGIDLRRSAPDVSRPFDDHLRKMIDRYGLGALFRDDGHAPYHHAIRPTGYDFYRDEVIPEGMEKWRADYREMSEERQMLAASVMWLYRARKDRVWLRRVPCTWQAADAIVCMNAAGALVDWARLYALYPGW